MEVVIEGRVDTTTAPRLEKIIREQMEDCQELIREYGEDGLYVFGRSAGSSGNAEADAETGEHGVAPGRRAGDGSSGNDWFFRFSDDRIGEAK